MPRDQYNFKLTVDGDTASILNREDGSIVKTVPAWIEDPESGVTIDLRERDTFKNQEMVDRFMNLVVLPLFPDDMNMQLESSYTADRQGRDRVPVPGYMRPLPRPSSPDFAVENYLATMETLRRKSQAGPTRHSSREAWVQLRDAKIFAVDTKMAYAFSDAWMSNIDEELHLPDPDWPEKFPFDSVWLGYDEAYRLDFDQTVNLTTPQEMPIWTTPSEMPIPERARQNQESANLIGHLVTAPGDMWTFLRNARGEVNYFRARSADAGWPDVEYIFCSELPPLVIEYVNQQRTFIVSEDVPGLRRRMKMNRKRLGLTGKHIIPPPFYRIRLRSKVIQEVAQRVADGMPASYRHDVRAHERCRVRRGPLPVHTDQREKLERLGYKIYTIEKLPAEMLIRFAERSIPLKRVNEWMAIKITWVNAHISPADESLPYVPALRTMSDSDEA